MNEWISVKDKLPETFERVLFCNRPELYLGSLWADGTWRDEEGRRIYDVVAWMPTPLPPEGSTYG